MRANRSVRLAVPLSMAALLLPSVSGAAERPPNVVLVFADDLGYGDVGVFGAQGYSTPHIDRLAAEGVRFTDFYVAQAVCTASRAALLTGAYPQRVGLTGAVDHRARHGISAEETTLAEMLKKGGYATAIYGKWHLGHLPPFLPTRHGFDDYYGLPYSNDMWPFHPERPGDYPPLPLIEGEETVETNPDQSQLTGEYGRRAVAFIEAHRDEPFFVYLAHSMPHVPIFASEAFRGRTPRGLFGDVIEEIDDTVGRILDTLERLGLDESTLVIFTSDNGPWLSYGDHAGSAGPLREGKGTSFDGGVGVPFLARWPGRIPAGTVVTEPAMTIDLLPTIGRLAGAPLPELPIDGKDIGPLLLGDPGAVSPHEALFFYWGRHLQAVRSGRWKLHFPHEYRSLDGPPGSGGMPGRYTQRSIGLALFDLRVDRSETTDVAAQHPDVVKRLEALAEEARKDLGDSATEQKGTGVREPGRAP
ncbi:MAG: sulfatase [Acidobacteria bacterium]|nr:sulfatase [Acidobacteriota bacterium]